MQHLDSSKQWRMTTGQDQEFAEVREHEFKLGLVNMTVGLSLAASHMQRIAFNLGLWFYHINIVK